jgi:hypothetical protein
MLPYDHSSPVNGDQTTDRISPGTEIIIRGAHRRDGTPVVVVPDVIQKPIFYSSFRSVSNVDTLWQIEKQSTNNHGRKLLRPTVRELLTIQKLETNKLLTINTKDART